MTSAKTFLRRAALAFFLFPLAGCNTIVLNAPGDIASRQGNLIMVATALMLLVIVPVIFLTLFFAWRYRASRNATYKPDWDHSTQLELVIWAAPLLIIIALGAITWISTHTLDPFRPLDRISKDKPLQPGVKPLVVEVVALDWKWLFFYPEQGIATINEMAVPVDRPVLFKLTASSVMNAFYIPAMAGMIYTMPSMETQLNAVMNKPGVYDGFSSNYSGAGFSHMRFKMHASDDAGFNNWIQKVKGDGGALDRGLYKELEKPSEKEPVRYFGNVDATLYHAILNRCVDPGQVCMDKMMAMDARGGHAGHATPADAGVATPGPAQMPGMGDMPHDPSQHGKDAQGAHRPTAQPEHQH